MPQYLALTHFNTNYWPDPSTNAPKSRGHRSVAWLVILALLTPPLLLAQPSFESRLREVMARPEYKHSRFGAAIYPIAAGAPLHRLNAQELFVPGSTTKLVTMGTALKLLGPDYRFHTPIYRTGEVTPDGVLHGDLVVVAGGDLNLSGRIQPDESLAFQNVDHAYWPMARAATVPGDPIQPIRAMARQVAAKGIKRVTGTLHIDAGLFPLGDRELGSGVAITPLAINDNVLDAFVEPGPREGEPAVIRLWPQTRFVIIVNELKTVPAGSKLDVNLVSDERRTDGGRQLTLRGSVPLGQKPALQTYKMADPMVFARFVFIEALAEAGVAVEAPGTDDGGNWTEFYKPANLLAEHISPPFLEDAKLTLKVSQNMHASATPYLVGALVGGKHADALDEGFRLERKLLEDAGLDTSGAVQSDGAGGAAMYTPDFMCQYLVYLSKQPFFDKLRPGLPVLGKEGTLWDIQTASPAVGKVFAKTGTYATEDRLHDALLITGKGLAGYMTTRDGHRVAFAFYVNSVVGDPAKVAHMAGEMLGELATAAWEANWK
ncbi:MAG: D-alanyl-D-alanine carboxypeptidase/D-alanyl-D-alanine-endopeptidase [Bryobacteraceae bacterium]